MRSVRPLVLVLALVAATVHAKGGGPLPGLTEVELAEFKDGFAAFRDQVFPEEGLGPVFNGRRCYLCHSNPALGGRSTRTRAIVTRFGSDDGGGFDPLDSLGGSLLQHIALTPECAEVIPPEANVVAQRNVTSAFGAGLIEAIPDQQIIDRAAAEQAANSAMAGRVHMVTGASDGLPHVGRFGWKATRALIYDMVGEALLNELGMTNALFPTENAPNGNLSLLAQCDAVPDPEDTADFLNKITHLLRYIGPPVYKKRVNAVALQGEALFHSIGCDFCHYTGYTAVSPIPAIGGQSVPIYSDLLLHDIGTGDGIVQGDAQGNEFRTPLIWLVAVGPYLHDGRARTLTEAIDAHRAQALPVRDAYFALPVADQQAILKFLKR